MNYFFLFLFQYYLLRLTKYTLDHLYQILLQYDAPCKNGESSSYATYRYTKGEQLLGLILGDYGERRNDRQRIAQTWMFYVKGTLKMPGLVHGCFTLITLLWSCNSRHHNRIRTANLRNTSSSPMLTGYNTDSCPTVIVSDIYQLSTNGLKPLVATSSARA